MCAGSFSYDCPQLLWSVCFEFSECQACLAGHPVHQGRRGESVFINSFTLGCSIGLSFSALTLFSVEFSASRYRRSNKYLTKINFRSFILLYMQFFFI